MLNSVVGDRPHALGDCLVLKVNTLSASWTIAARTAARMFFFLWWKRGVSAMTQSQPVFKDRRPIGLHAGNRNATYSQPSHHAVVRGAISSDPQRGLLPIKPRTAILKKLLETSFGTTLIPIVFAVANDPIGSGLVALQGNKRVA
jgi:hypothetical protein